MVRQRHKIVHVDKCDFRPYQLHLLRRQLLRFASLDRHLPTQPRISVAHFSGAILFACS